MWKRKLLWLILGRFLHLRNKSPPIPKRVPTGSSHLPYIVSTSLSPSCAAVGHGSIAIGDPRTAAIILDCLGHGERRCRLERDDQRPGRSGLRWALLPRQVADPGRDLPARGRCPPQERLPRGGAHRPVRGRRALLQRASASTARMPAAGTPTRGWATPSASALASARVRPNSICTDFMLHWKRFRFSYLFAHLLMYLYAMESIPISYSSIPDACHNSISVI